MEDSSHLRDFRHQKQLIIMIRLNPLHSKTFTQFFYDRNEDLPCAIRKNPHFYFLYIRCLIIGREVTDKSVQKSIII